MRAALAPLGALYGVAARGRLALYRKGLLRITRLAAPVVSVGNLSVGGSGKTPVVALIAELLRDAGHPVAVLSRGYGGGFRGEVLVVSDGSAVHASAAEAGDEPVMLARDLPGVVVAVGPRRDVVGRRVLERFGRRVLVLDDGFQHLRLARDLDVLCLDARDLVDRPLPAGRLRESPSAAERAGLVLLSGGDPRVFDDCARRFGPERCFRLGRRVRGFFDLAGQERPAPRRPFLAAGIARPERFQADVEALAQAVPGTAFFRDHHSFGSGEVADLVARARSLEADALVITAKDAVRFPGTGATIPILVLRIAAAVEDEARFLERLLATVGGRA